MHWPMACRSDDWVCELLARLGLSGFVADTVNLLVAQPLKIVLILLAAVVLSKVGRRFARRAVETIGARSPVSDRSVRSQQRATTLGGVASSAVRVVVWTLASLAVLDEVGFNLGPLVAGASIVGVAVGFGAQSLVRDFLSGFFILAEDQYGVGDTITVADVTGEVEDVDLRVTRIRAIDGTVWFVPNGEIRKVGNSAKGWSLATADVVVPRGAPLDSVLTLVGQASTTMADDPAWSNRIAGRPDSHVEAVAVDGVTVRVVVRTTPGDRAAVARELRARVVAHLQRQGIGGVEAPPLGSVPDEDASSVPDDDSSQNPS